MINYYVKSQYSTASGMNTRFVKSPITGSILYESIEEAQLAKANEMLRVATFKTAFQTVTISEVT